jgi:hypothetical protein
MRRFSAWFALSMIMLNGSAHAQGVFDMGALTNTIAGTAQAQSQGTPAATPTAAAVASLRYTPSLEVRKANMAKFIAGLKQMNAEAGAQMEQGLAQTDVIAVISEGIGKYGLDANNIADAYSVYLISGWMMANGRTDDPTAAQINGTRNMVVGLMTATPQIAKLSDADKQSFAEGLLLQFFLNEATAQAVTNDPAATQKVRNDVKTGVQSVLNVNLDAFTMSANGLVRK